MCPAGKCPPPWQLLGGTQSCSKSCISFTVSLCCFLCWKVGMMVAGVLGLPRQTDRRCLCPETNPEELTHCYMSLKPTLKEPVARAAHTSVRRLRAWHLGGLNTHSSQLAH